MGNLMAFLSCHAGNWNFLRNKFFISGLKSNHHVSLKCLRQCSIKTDFWCQFVTCHQLTPGEKNLRNGFSCPSCLLQPNIRAKLVYANLRMNSTGLPNYVGRTSSRTMRSLSIDLRARFVGLIRIFHAPFM